MTFLLPPRPRAVSAQDEKWRDKAPCRGRLGPLPTGGHTAARGDSPQSTPLQPRVVRRPVGDPRGNEVEIKAFTSI